MAINRNKVAKQISVEEGLKVEVNIAQIKEVMRCMLGILSDYSDEDIIKLINKYRIS